MKNILLLGLALTITSCGSFQYTGYLNTNDGNYYSDYFGSLVVGADGVETVKPRQQININLASTSYRGYNSFYDGYGIDYGIGYGIGYGYNNFGFGLGYNNSFYNNYNGYYGGPIIYGGNRSVRRSNAGPRVSRRSTQTTTRTRVNPRSTNKRTYSTSRNVNRRPTTTRSRNTNSRPTTTRRAPQRSYRPAARTSQRSTQTTNRRRN